MLPSDLVRLRHLRDAAIEAASFAAGRQRCNLDDDRMLALALVKAIELLPLLPGASWQRCAGRAPT